MTQLHRAKNRSTEGILKECGATMISLLFIEIK